MTDAIEAIIILCLGFGVLLGIGMIVSFVIDITPVSDTYTKIQIDDDTLQVNKHWMQYAKGGGYWYYSNEYLIHDSISNRWFKTISLTKYNQLTQPGVHYIKYNAFMDVLDVRGDIVYDFNDFTEMITSPFFYYRLYTNSLTDDDKYLINTTAVALIR